MTEADLNLSEIDLSQRNEIQALFEKAGELAGDKGGVFQADLESF